MIETNILANYPLHNIAGPYAGNLYIADYTNQTAGVTGVVLASPVSPTNIEYFSLINDPSIDLKAVVFDNTSFTRVNGTTLSQCECVVFPSNSNNNSWILFTELKYSSQSKNNKKNLRKAIIQLYKTRTYYLNKGVYTNSSNCYLFASLPKQGTPFPNFTLPPAHGTNLKRKHNVILRLANSARILNDKIII